MTKKKKTHKKKSNLVQLESRGHHSQNSLATSSARVVDVLEEGSLNKTWCRLVRWHFCAPSALRWMRRGVKTGARSKRGQQTWGRTMKHISHHASVMQGLELLHPWPRVLPTAGALLAASVQSSQPQQPLLRVVACTLQLCCKSVGFLLLLL